MGNRAVIAQRIDGVPREYSPAIYLHWNGGRDSVQAFLDAAKHLKLRGDDYGFARLTQIIGNFFGGGESLGISVLSRLDADNYDNGLYWINGNFEIVDREFVQGAEQANYDRLEMKEYVLWCNRHVFGVEPEIVERVEKRELREIA